MPEGGLEEIDKYGLGGTALQQLRAAQQLSVSHTRLLCAILELICVVQGGWACPKFSECKRCNTSSSPDLKGKVQCLILAVVHCSIQETCKVCILRKTLGIFLGNYLV